MGHNHDRAARQASLMRRDHKPMSAKDIAKLDAKEYKEPGRDLMATRPVQGGEGGGGGRGDEDNPVAYKGVPGSMGTTENKLGSDEHNRLAKGRQS